MANRTTDADIEAAFTQGQILRTHVMRPTWHFVTPNDITWMLELTASRVHAAMGSYVRKQGLDNRVLRRATAIIERELGDGRHLTRAELASRLAGRKMNFSPLQLALVMFYAELERIVCSGPRRGKQHTYALLSERVAAATPGRRKPRSKVTTDRVPGNRDEALAELARRFFSRHGPATVRDFVWWSGLRTPDARRGIDIIKPTRFDLEALTYWTIEAPDPVSTRPERVHLLPIYDEYVVAYRDRAAMPPGPGTVRADRRAGTFRHALVVDGQIAGTWRTEPKRSGTVVHVSAFSPPSRSERQGIEAAVARYGRFLQATVTLSLRSS